MANLNPQTGKLVPTWAERKQFNELCEQARALTAYRDARIKVASMSPDERAAAIATAERSRLARWQRDPQTVARLARRMSGAIIRK